jgi:hypothetical protein
VTSVLGGSGFGLYGLAPSHAVVGSSNGGGHGVYGYASANVGVFGQSTVSNGVWGYSGTAAAGVYGTSVASHGVHGKTDAANGFGVYGRGDGPAGYGVYGSSIQGDGTGVYGFGYARGVWGSSPGGYAGQFNGNVVVTGTLSVYGGKAAVVPHPDGTYRRLYCVESPDSVFEDFAQGTLTAGRAQVRIDPEFALTVKTDKYSVFLTPEGDCKGLYVTAKTPTSFEVRELQGGTSSLSFSYRIVAMRKDVEAPRLERVQFDPAKTKLPEPPQIREPELPAPPPPLPVDFSAPPAGVAPQPSITPGRPTSIAQPTSVPSGTPTAQSTPVPSSTPTTQPTAAPSPNAI